MSFLAELKRRNVIRVAVLYVVASWLTLQVADLLFDIIRVPDWSLRLVFGLLALGFPAAHVLSQVYERTPYGPRRDSEAGPAAVPDPRRSRKLEIVAVVLVLLGIGVVVADRLLPADGAAPAAARSPALAAADAAGQAAPAQPVKIPQTLLASPSCPSRTFRETSATSTSPRGSPTRCSTGWPRSPGLKVIARNSSFQFKGANLEVREIGQGLAVDEGNPGGNPGAGPRQVADSQKVRGSGSGFCNA